MPAVILSGLGFIAFAAVGLGVNAREARLIFKFLLFGLVTAFATLVALVGAGRRAIAARRSGGDGGEGAESARPSRARRKSADAPKAAEPSLRRSLNPMVRRGGSETVDEGADPSPAHGGPDDDRISARIAAAVRKRDQMRRQDAGVDTAVIDLEDDDVHSLPAAPQPAPAYEEPPRAQDKPEPRVRQLMPKLGRKSKTALAEEQPELALDKEPEDEAPEAYQTPPSRARSSASAPARSSPCTSWSPPPASRPAAWSAWPTTSPAR